MCRKNEGRFREASAELGRMRLYAMDETELADYYYQKALCLCLDGGFAESCAVVDEMRLSVADSLTVSDTWLVEALAAAGNGEMKRSEAAARKWAEKAVPAERKENFYKELSKFYRHVPSLKNPRTAYWLSLVPGLGQLYAGAPGSAAWSFAVNGALAAFGVSEVLGGYYLGAWIISGGLMSSTYFVGMERAEKLTAEHNARATARYGDRLKSMLLDAAE